LSGVSMSSTIPVNVSVAPGALFLPEGDLLGTSQGLA
jgi:hypothetical protein